jgi:UDP-N-acetylglucosamine--N-acetylmuramyl-(pentapeptide) pyrophosphoryl-undecaprenol N-acetylglucosamine transferase
MVLLLTTPRAARGHGEAQADPVRPIASIVIAGGGTGGHVFPGVAIGDEVKRRNPEARVVFIGTERGLEKKLVPAAGHELFTINVSRLKGGGLWAKVKGLFRLPIAIFQSWRILRKVKPEVVIGVGGYASGPALLAAWMTFRKTAIQEQNATPGMTNRFLGKLVKRVFAGLPTTRFSPKKLVLTGNPIRHAIAERLENREIRAASADLRMLIFGGSQGATFLNERVPSLLAALDRAQGASAGSASPSPRITITHQTGERDLDATRARYAELGLNAQVLPFIEDMASAYAQSDLAICRAGALTIAELTAVGLPSVLVPFPFAADNHQEANARVLEAAGAGLVATQASWDESALVARLETLAQDRQALSAMAEAARGLGRIHAVATIVDHLEGLR